MKPKQVIVLGGNGFIGNAVVKELQRRRIEALIGTRGRNRTLAPGERRIVFHNASKKEWRALINDCDVVINAVGILRQRWGETYEQVHHHAVAELARVCAKNQVKLIHVSALGIYNKVTSRFLTSKRRGEAALLGSTADWYIVRPSLLDGPNGYGAKWFRKIAQWPVHIAPAKTGRVAPLDVRELARRIADIVEYNFTQRVHEIGGSRTFEYHQYLRNLAKRPPKFNIRIPVLLARLASHLCDLLHITPLTFGHYELMRYDNLPNTHALQSQQQTKELLAVKESRYVTSISLNPKGPRLFA